jgi:hypothetical protein
LKTDILGINAVDGPQVGGDRITAFIVIVTFGTYAQLMQAKVRMGIDDAGH